MSSADATDNDVLPDLADFDPFSRDVQQNPAPWFRAMRKNGPVFAHSTGYYIVRYDAVDAVLRSDDIFSSRSLKHQRTAPDRSETAHQVASIRQGGWPEVPALLTQDDPVHRRQRALVGQAFNHRRVRETEPLIVDLVSELTNGLIEHGSGDFIQIFGKPLPLRLIASLLSVPDDGLEALKKWTEYRLRNLGNKVDDDDQIAIARSEVERQQYFSRLFDDRSVDPKDDLLTAMVEAKLGAEDDIQGEPLSREELLTMVGMLMTAGNETTTSLLAQTMLHMSRNPDDWKFLRENPAERAPSVIEEALRMFAPTQMMPRIATEDTTVEGTPIPAGSLVQVVFASANRDSEHFDNADTFDPRRRNVREHFAFGRGTHLCLGSTLARMEARIALAGLAETIESFRVLDDPPVYHESFRQRGLQGLNIEIVPA